MEASTGFPVCLESSQYLVMETHSLTPPEQSPAAEDRASVPPPACDAAVVAAPSAAPLPSASAVPSVLAQILVHGPVDYPPFVVSKSMAMPVPDPPSSPSELFEQL